MKLSRAAMRRLGLVPVLIALGLLSVTAHDEAASPSRAFEFTCMTRVPKPPADAKMLRLWIPLPQSDAYQTIRRMRIASPVRYSRQREAEYGNQYLYAEIPAAQVTKPLEIRLSFEVVRREHRVALGPTSAGTTAANTDDPPEKLARFLAPDRLVPTDGVIGALAAQETRGLTTPLDKARAIYNYVVSTMRYDKSGEGWGRGDAVFACNAKRGNCTDFHSLFIGMMRAAGIPARFEIGFPLPEDKHAASITGYHCWAEFYVEPYGWIPVDASEAWKNPSKREYFFGAHDANRVEFTLGRDIRLQPAQQGEPINYFIYPYAEADGKPYTALRYEFSFRDLAARTRRSE